MRLTLIAVGEKMPDWVAQGFAEYAKRMPREAALQLIEIRPARHGKGETARAVADEGKRILAALPERCRVVALDERGQLWTTAQLAARLKAWLQEGQDVAFLIGGADGMAEECKRAAHDTWSLSPLTLPHGLVRVIAAEQLYRAWSILQNHPYHRA